MTAVGDARAGPQAGDAPSAVLALPEQGRRRALLSLRLARALTARLPCGWWASAVARPAAVRAAVGAPGLAAEAAPPRRPDARSVEAGLVVVAAEPLPADGAVAEPALVAELAPHGLGPRHWRDQGVPVAWWLGAEDVVVSDELGERRLPAPARLPLPALEPPAPRLALSWPLPDEPIVLPETTAW